MESNMLNTATVNITSKYIRKPVLNIAEYQNPNTTKIRKLKWKKYKQNTLIHILIENKNNTVIVYFKIKESKTSQLSIYPDQLKCEKPKAGNTKQLKM